MIHPFFTALLTRPELMAEHASAYVELASVEAAMAANEWRRCAIWGGCAMVLALLAVGWAGIALMLMAAWPLAQMPAPWVLAALPSLALTLALGVALYVGLRHRHSSASFALLRQQMAQDGALLREGLAHG